MFKHPALAKWHDTVASRINHSLGTLGMGKFAMLAFVVILDRRQPVTAFIDMMFKGKYPILPSDPRLAFIHIESLFIQIDEYETREILDANFRDANACSIKSGH